MSILITVIALVLVFWFTAAFLPMEGVMALKNYIDMPSLIILLLLVIPVLISAGMFKDFRASFRRAFSAQVTCTRVELQRSMEAVKLARKSSYTAGLFGFLVSLVYVCKCYDASMEHVFWLNMAVAVIPVTYAVTFDLIFLAVYGRLKKRYMDFMLMGYEMTEKETAAAAVVRQVCDVADVTQEPEDGERQA